VRRLPIVHRTPSAERVQQPVFYYDLGDPACYLVAEQIMAALPVVPEWEPVFARAIGPDALPAAPSARAALERRAAELGIQPFRWPDCWPPDSRQALLAATYAKRIGRGVAFSLAAFRQAFAAGRDLGDENTVVIAGAACEMHPAALLRGIATKAVQQALDAASGRARRVGVVSLPAINIGDRVYLDIGEAAEALR
jgi:2-hydroxychromene-2-carboxylate isomerase